MGGKKTGIQAGLCIVAMLAGMVLLAPALAATTATDAFIGPGNVLEGDAAIDEGTNVGATLEPGEPTSVDGVPVDHSVWETWTAPGPGTVTVDTCLSNFDTALAAYTGSSVSALTPVRENDDAVPPCPIAEPEADARASRIVFPVVAGTTYHVAVTGKAGATGDFELRLNFEPPPGNDSFAAAAQLSGNSTGASALNVGSSKEAGEPPLAGNAGGASIWWRWTTPKAGPATIDTCLSNFDTLLGVYTGPNVATLTPTAENDDSAQCPGAHTGSKIAFAADAGTTYWIGVDGKNAGSGPQVGHVQLNLVSPSGTPALNQSLLPDLVPAPADAGTAKTYDKEGLKWINIGFRIRNIGDGPLEVFPEVEDQPNDCNENGDAGDDRIAMQNYYLDSNGDGVFERDVDTDVRTRQAGCNEFHPAHGHWHSEVVGNALISEASGATVRSLEKITFCLTDWSVDDPGQPGFAPGAYYPLGNCDQVSLQGVSVGWADQYSAGYASQYMDITGLSAGNYCIRTNVDLSGNLLEKSKTNNVADRRIFLDPSQSPPTLSLLPGPCQFNATPPTNTPPATPPETSSPKGAVPNETPAAESEPSTTISQLAVQRRTRRVTVRFNGNEPGAPRPVLKFECKLDGGPYTRCASPKTYARVGVGRHTIKVRAVDLAGNADPSPAERRFQVRRGRR